MCSFHRRRSIPADRLGGFLNGPNRKTQGCEPRKRSELRQGLRERTERMFFCPYREIIHFFRSELGFQIRYLNERDAVAARLQLMRECEKWIYVSGDWRADDTEVSQLPGDRKGG